MQVPQNATKADQNGLTETFPRGNEQVKMNRWEKEPHSALSILQICWEKARERGGLLASLGEKKVKRGIKNSLLVDES
jgi:hypothetical protein